MPESIVSTEPNSISNTAFGISRRVMGDDLIETVDARSLHAFLEIGKDFSNWIKDRVAAYGFAENSDYVVYANSGENPSADCSPELASKGRGGHNRLEYAITLDMAKELAMVERNAKGKEARLYFIECERRAKGQMDAAVALSDPAALRHLLLVNVEKVLTLQGQVAAAAPKVEAFDRIAGAVGSLCLTEGAKALQMRRSDLERELLARAWIYRRAGSGTWLGYADKVQRGLLTHKVSTGRRADGSEWLSEQFRITPKGLTLLATLLGREGALAA